MNNRSAFTLIEMTVVIAIIAMFATVVIVRYKAPLATAKVQNVIERLEHQDRLLRNFAKQHSRPVLLAVDQETGIFTPQNSGSVPCGVQPVTLPSGVQLECLYIGTEVADKIHYASDGTSPTYVLGLKSGDGKVTWLLVIGATGQTVRSADEALLAELGVGPKR